MTILGKKCTMFVSKHTQMLKIAGFRGLAMASNELLFVGNHNDQREDSEELLYQNRVFKYGSKSDLQ